MNKVGIVQCQNYEYEQVEAAVRDSIDLFGGMGKLVQPGQKVLLKVNLLAAVPPEKAVTTHPAVVRALAGLVREAGGRPLVADSPGPVPYTRGGLKRAYYAAGFLDLAEEGIVELNWDTGKVGIPYSEGRVVKYFEVIRPVVEADVVIALPKLKTHMFTTITGATKILFGVIPGLAKAGYHAKLQNGEQFAEMLLDIVGAVQPVFYLMDGVVALEGDGPGLHGRPRSLGVILGSRNAVAMDVVACQVAGINPLHVPMLASAVNRGWWDGKGESFETVGVPVETVAVRDFKMPAKIARDARGLDRVPWYQRVCAPVVKQALSPRPVPNKDRCTGCATCRRVCPQNAVSMSRDKPVINDHACIRCYCCHEMCPEAAVDLKYGLLGKIISRVGLLGR